MTRKLEGQELEAAKLRRATWIEALESGKFKQHQGSLKSEVDSDAYCCLGVCHVVVPGILAWGAILTSESCALVGLTEPDQRELSSLNDSPEADISFYEIAQLLRHMPYEATESV